MSDYCWMDPEDAAEMIATARAIKDLRAEGVEDTGDALLNAATERAGYCVEHSRVELCHHCAQLYHKAYGGEYVDPDDHDDLLDLLDTDREHLMAFEYQHFCDMNCLRAALAQAQEEVAS